MFMTKFYNLFKNAVWIKRPKTLKGKGIPSHTWTWRAVGEKLTVVEKKFD